MSFDVPKIMGIINLTPDSFFASSRKSGEAEIMAQVEKMLDEGADLIDLGAVSTRPGSAEVSLDEEKTRLFSILPQLCKQFPDVPFSIDTYRSEIAVEAVNCGAAIINDISGTCMDERMIETIARLQVPYVLMHMRGTPQTMTQFTEYNRPLEDVIFELSEKLQALRLAGVNDIIIDPGFGFAKTIAHNFQLLDRLEQFHCFGMPVLVGISRKKTIHKTLGITPEESLNGTTFLHAIALEKGAHILRVHDVKAATECVKLHTALKEWKTPE